MSNVSNSVEKSEIVEVGTFLNTMDILTLLHMFGYINSYRLTKFSDGSTGVEITELTPYNVVWC